MAKCENLEEPREGLIRQEIISYVWENDKVVKKKVSRTYHVDGEDYIDTQSSEPIVRLGENNAT